MSDTGRKLPPEPLTAVEVAALVRSVGRGITGKRNAALVATMFETGLRVSEALDLELRDLDLDNGSVRVRHGKGDKFRVVGLGVGAERALQAWLDVRPRTASADAPQFVFCTLDGGPVMSSYVRQLMPRLGERAGIDKRVHAHGLRHGHALHLLRNGMSLQAISGQLGHANLATTERYLRRLAPDEVVKLVRRAFDTGVETAGGEDTEPGEGSLGPG